MNEYTNECRAANTIASRLRSTVYVPPPKVGKPKGAAKNGLRVGRPPGKSMVLTAPQQRVLDYLRLFFIANDQLPPLSAMKRHFGWNTVSAAQTYLMHLHRKGAIERNEVNGWRFPRMVGVSQ